MSSQLDHHWTRVVLDSNTSALWCCVVTGSIPSVRPQQGLGHRCVSNPGSLRSSSRPAWGSILDNDSRENSNDRVHGFLDQSIQAILCLRNIQTSSRASFRIHHSLVYPVYYVQFHETHPFLVAKHCGIFKFAHHEVLFVCIQIQSIFMLGISKLQCLVLPKVLDQFGFIQQHCLCQCGWYVLLELFQLDGIKFLHTINYCVFGVPGRIRTSDPKFRKLVFYPTELRAHISGGSEGTRTLDLSRDRRSL